MLDFVTGLQILLIVLVAMTIFAGVWIIGECFDSWGDFIKSLTDNEYNYLSFVFRKGKHIRFITDFPNDLRKECLGKESYYADKEDDSAGVRKAKMLVRRVLGNDAIVNEYFKGQYFTYKDFLEVKELCDLPEYDETSELLDELGAHLKDPKLAGAMKELMIEVMIDDLVVFKAGKREAALLKAALFVQEERSGDMAGCRGARACDLSFFDDVAYILECDRKGSSDVVSIGKGDTVLCPPDFIPEDILHKHGYEMVRGGKTDVVELKMRGLEIPVCNISCGYYNAHKNSEYTRFSELTQCLAFVREVMRSKKDLVKILEGKQ